MKSDGRFKALCERHGLPWNFAAGYEPRGYNGPAPEQTKLLVLLAEPGAITPTEARNLLPAISHRRWVEPDNLRLQEHYWRANLLELCRYIWPENTEDSMYTDVGKSCTFWMSLPPGAQTSQIPREPLDYFLQTYLKRFLALFPNAILLAAGGKAHARLRRLNIEFESCGRQRRRLFRGREARALSGTRHDVDRAGQALPRVVP
jgi:hypothetical protein